MSDPKAKCPPGYKPNPLHEVMYDYSDPYWEVYEEQDQNFGLDVPRYVPEEKPCQK